jgi:L-amino acid N-acyltransferase YncA
MQPAPTRAVSVTAMLADHWTQVRDIYAEGIAGGNATFENDLPTQENWDAGHLKPCRLVARSGAGILGWAALSPVSGRCVYSGVAEVGIYVRASARGQGIGTELMRRLIGGSEAEGLWTLQAGIFPENLASLNLHRNFGFRVVGRRERIGCMNGRWRDVILLERRSRVAGM